LRKTLLPQQHTVFVILARHHHIMAPIAISEENHLNGYSNKSPLKAAAAAPASQSPSKYHVASSDEAIHTEDKYAAHNYHPLPIVFARASGCNVWDPEGRQYLDFLSAYSAVNQGHCHPELVKTMTEQASTLTLSSRAFYNDVFPKFAEFVTKYFAFDRVLPMNTGAEAVETAVKIARKWGYKVKGIPANQALVLSVANNFHGRTVSVAFHHRFRSDR
jgi:ornithine--oxo-acid transaminase